jgi:uncharacterized protein
MISPHGFGPGRIPCAGADPVGTCVARRAGEGRKGATLEPHIQVITLGVDDLERSLVFYRDGLGLPTDGVIGTEFAGDDENAAGAVVMFKLEGGLIFAIYPRSELAKDAKVPPAASTSGQFSIGHSVSSRAEVDALLTRAIAAGGESTGPAQDRPWGIYSGYFRDPDGHLWEVMWNPRLDTQDG